MLANLDTYAAALKVERTHALMRAEHRVPLFEAAKRRPVMSPAHRAKGIRLRLIAVVAGLALGLAVTAGVAAHPHTARIPGTIQVTANDQIHGSFVDGISNGGDPVACPLGAADHGLGPLNNTEIDRTSAKANAARVLWPPPAGRENLQSGSRCRARVPRPLPRSSDVISGPVHE